MSGVAKALQLITLQRLLGNDDERAAAHQSVEVLTWVCSACDKACIPVRSESRCLCGHRLKEHDKPSGAGVYRSALLRVQSGQTVVLHRKVASD